MQKLIDATDEWIRPMPPGGIAVSTVLTTVIGGIGAVLRWFR